MSPRTAHRTPQDREIERLRRTLDDLNASARQRVEQLEAQNAALMDQLVRRAELETSPVFVMPTPGESITTELAAMERSRTIGLILDSTERPDLRLREPSRDEMLACLGDRDELAVGDRCPDSWPTIRRCRHCREPVAGGPTACVSCVARREGDARADLADAVECGRVVVHVMIDRDPKSMHPITPHVLLGPLPAAMTVRLSDDHIIEADAKLVGALACLYRCVDRGITLDEGMAAPLDVCREMMQQRRAFAAHPDAEQVGPQETE